MSLSCSGIEKIDKGVPKPLPTIPVFPPLEEELILAV